MWLCDCNTYSCNCMLMWFHVQLSPGLKWSWWRSQTALTRPHWCAALTAFTLQPSLWRGWGTGRRLKEVWRPLRRWLMETGTIRSTPIWSTCLNLERRSPVWSNTPASPNPWTTSGVSLITTVRSKSCFTQIITPSVNNSFCYLSTITPDVRQPASSHQQ